MGITIKIIIAFISTLHLYFLWFEMFAWTSRGPKIFRKFPKDLFSQTKSMAANQGLYNAFLATGLLWTFYRKRGMDYEYFAFLFRLCSSCSNRWRIDGK
ncbi:DUF1304 domain-containing protein [Maribacter antarcticus]|uniref:DUF1304 domain-containing protein n=1 Tax=Maribacter antarcticus TaxID=505250 RepID=UPI00373FDC70